jgi:hypothetical protein
MNEPSLYNISFSRLHHPEVGQIVNRFFEDIAKSNSNTAIDPDFQRLYSTLDAQRPLFQLSLDQIKAREETDFIAQLDQNRDNDIQALRFGLRAYNNTRIEAKKKANTALNIIFNQYKGVEADSYEQETIRLNNLIATLNNPENMPHIALLNLVEFVVNLSTSNTTFNELFANRSYKTAIQTVYDTKKLREQLIVDFKILTAYVYAMALAKNTSFYTDILAIINNSRQYYANIMAPRKG